MENLTTSANERMNAIEDQLFNVVVSPLINANPDFIVNDVNGIFKENGGGILGVVGKNFVPTQPKIVFDSFCDSIVQLKLNVDSLKFTEINAGEIVRFSIQLKNLAYKNKLGVDDVTETFLTLQLGLNGKTKTSMYVETMRLICTNGMKAKQTEFATSFKNTKGNLGKIIGMYTDVVKCVSQIEKVDEFNKAMLNVKVDQTAINDFIKKVTDYEMREYNNYAKKTQNLLDNLNESIDLEIGRTGDNLFGLFNGFTHYANHKINTKDEDSIFSGVGSKIIEKTEKFALQLV